MYGITDVETELNEIVIPSGKPEAKHIGTKEDAAKNVASNSRLEKAKTQRQAKTLLATRKLNVIYTNHPRLRIAD